VTFVGRLHSFLLFRDEDRSSYQSDRPPPPSLPHQPLFLPPKFCGVPSRPTAPSHLERVTRVVRAFSFPFTLLFYPTFHSPLFPPFTSTLFHRVPLRIRRAYSSRVLAPVVPFPLNLLLFGRRCAHTRPTLPSSAGTAPSSRPCESVFPVPLRRYSLPFYGSVLFVVLVL